MDLSNNASVGTQEASTSNTKRIHIVICKAYNKNHYKKMACE
jgi:hypothetical protein